MKHRIDSRTKAAMADRRRRIADVYAFQAWLNFDWDEYVRQANIAVAYAFAVAAEMMRQTVIMLEEYGKKSSK